MNTLNIERLKECRLKLGITKQEAAKRIGISQPAYLRYEAGTRNPSIHTISKMAEVFSTSNDYLVGMTDESKPDKIIIEKNKKASLFQLFETCKDFDETHIKRLITYAKKLSKTKSDDLRR